MILYTRFFFYIHVIKIDTVQTKQFCSFVSEGSAEIVAEKSETELCKKCSHTRIIQLMNEILFHTHKKAKSISLFSKLSCSAYN